jgi:predicted DNA-binding mobile mystery protein A
MRKDIRQRARRRLDERLFALKSVDRFKAPPRGWIRAVRDALGMTGKQLASRLGIRPQSLVNLEKSEANATIRLDTLQRTAEALGCTLVYALVPKSSLEDQVQERAHQIARRDLLRVAHTMKLEAQETGDANLNERIEAYIRDELKDRELWNEP